MSSDSNDTPTPLAPLQPMKLDAEAGPARWLSPAESAAFVSATLRAHAARKQQRRRHLYQLAAGFALFLGASAAVSAAWLWQTPRSSNTSKAAEAPSPPPVAERPNTPPPAPAEAPQPTHEVVVPQEVRRAQTPPSVSDLLAHANQLRREAHWAAAAHAYERAVRSSPRSQEAYAAMVAAGGLYVDKLRKPARGATLFLRALSSRPSGALAEEARWGLAQAYKSLGNRRAERNALKSFLQHHPHGALSSQAQARLQHLGP